MYQEHACCPHTVWMLYLLFTYFNIMLILFMSVKVTNGKPPFFSPQIVHCKAGGLFGLSGHFFKCVCKYLTLKGPAAQ